MIYVEIIACLYLFCLELVVKADDFVAKLLFKVFPFLIALGLAVDILLRMGYLTKVL